MMAARLLSAWHTPRRALARRRAALWDRLRGPARPDARAGSARRLGRVVPLPAAIDAERRELATADVGTLSYYADTSAGGRPLVLLHRLHPAASSYELRPLFETFRGVRSVYALDLPGFGFSERSARPYNSAVYMRAIEHLLRQVITSEGADVLACSLSCEYAAMLAVEVPQLVRSLALISPTGFASPHELGPLERRARRAPSRHAARLAESALARLAYEAWVARPSLSFALRRSLERRVDLALGAYAYATSHQPGAFRAPVAWLLGELFPVGDPLKLYGRVRIPTLVLYDQDPHTGFGELAGFAAQHPAFRLERVAHARGLPQLDAPEQTAEALRTFYKGLDLQRVWRAGIATTRFIGSA